MKKKVFLLVILLTTFCVNAQKILTQEQYQEVVDYMTYVCVTDAMNKNVDYENKGSISRDQINKDETITLALFDEFNTLKNTDITKERTVDFLTKGILTSNKYEKIKGFAEKRKGNKIDEILLNIVKQADLIISGEMNEEVQSSDQEGENNIEASTSLLEQESGDEVYDNSIAETKVPEYGALDFMKDYGFSLILFMLIIVLFIYQKQRNFASINRVEFMINESERNREPRPASNLANVLNSQNLELEGLLKRMNEKIESLENEVRRLKDNQVQSKMDVLSPVVTLEVPKVPMVNQEEIVFYKHAPYDNGSFDADNDVSLNDAVFRFTINKDNANSASFELINDKKKLILDYPNKYIKPVCDELNALNQNANSISVIPGIVEKRNNQWVVKTKAKIKYE